MVCEQQQNGMVLTLLRNPKNRQKGNSPKREVGHFVVCEVPAPQNPHNGFGGLGSQLQLVVLPHLS